MPNLSVHKFPDPILRKKASRVTKVTSKEAELLDEMAKTMYLCQGVGLAAVQVGIYKQLAVIDVGSGLLKLVNPVIVARQGVEIAEEGCLSVPDVCVKVRRSRSVTVNFMDEKGEGRRLRADGLLARAVQHELDHLAGILIIDRVSPLKKMLLKRRMRKKRE